MHHAPITRILKGVVGFSFLAAVGFSALAPLAGIELTETARTAATITGAIIGGVLGARA
jgi:hypothetical protein